MYRRSTVPLLLLLLTLAACSSGSNAGSTTDAVKLSSPSWEKAKPYPSKSATMICQSEVRGEITNALHIKATRVVPAWNVNSHLYACTYGYPGGKIVLSVKEMSNERETTAYFDAVEKQYGTKESLLGLGQGAFLLENQDVVVRKDYKVLLVDVHGIPASFAAPLFDRSGVSQTIASAILGCWTGA